MKEGRDYSIIYHINSHYNDLNDDLKGIDTFKQFVDNKERRRAILFDFLQIGELMNQLSKSFKGNFNNKHADDLISMRNRVVHGYSTIKDRIIFNTLKNHLPSFIDELNAFANKRYQEHLQKLMGKKVKVIIDERVDSISYGYTEVLTTLDGRFQEAIVLNNYGQSDLLSGYVIALIKHKKDNTIRLLISKNKKELSDTDLDNKVFDDYMLK